ncbi:PD-(D/E)XK nuclease family protein [Vulcanisaeta thermophila]|uniref:PD-(D/E)XK nuclease family protein n=1 Tax=Vulcanisaeta thermophila TaxID=867917 RepID=UPI000853C3E1|nr:PD-(D/E)XK nuclease family protein [Vulcanisaeta thermophila]
MSLADEIKKVLMEHPEILVEVLVSRPEIIYEALSKIAPWQNLATKDDIRRLEERISALEARMTTVEAKMATKDDLKQFAIKEDLKQFATKEDLKQFATKDDLRQFATKEDLKREIRRLENMITALGARWGIFSEDAFRQGLLEILKDAGWSVSQELIYDRDGYVFGEPSEVEISIVIKDGRVIMVELTSALKRGDLPIIKRKRELYEKLKGTTISNVYVITPFIHDKYPDRVKAMARDMGIEVVYPTP